MSTENGLLRPKEMTRHIEALRNRRDWIIERGKERAAAGLPINLWDVEIAALAWAIECMEVERDATLRLRRTLGFDPDGGPRGDDTQTSTRVESAALSGYAPRTSPEGVPDAQDA